MEVQILLALLLVLLSVGAWAQVETQVETQLQTAAANSSGTAAAGSEAAAPAGLWRQARRRNSLTDSCSTNDGMTGTCLTRFKCMRQGGTANGYCGTYGVCCEISMQTGSVSRQKRIIIKSPAAVTSDSYQYNIEAYSLNVQQLRIDFELFELSQPTLNADDDTLECQDYFEVDQFTLCGYNTGQHLYLPFNVAGGMDHITLTFNVPMRSTPPTWRLVVTQLEAPVANRKTNMLGGLGAASNSLQSLRSIFAAHHADYDLLAPAGCHQYYTELRGTIRSFNYKQALGANYMNSLSYTICIKPVSSASMIEYTFSKFSLGLQSDDGEGYDESCHATVQTSGRQEDYLMIPQSLLAKNMDYQPTYYCGTNDNLVVYASPPYILYFSSDKYTINAARETGFTMTYSLRTSTL